MASLDEIVTFVTDSLNNDQSQAWTGVMISSCGATRSIKVSDIVERAVCIFDTAKLTNPSHAEICQTHHIQEADNPELRRELLAAFGDGIPIKPSDYRQGSVWEKLSSTLRQRPSAVKH